MREYGELDQSYASVDRTSVFQLLNPQIQVERQLKLAVLNSCTIWDILVATIIINKIF